MSHLYAPWPEGARRTWGFGAIALSYLSFVVVSTIAGVIAIFTVLPGMIEALSADGAEPDPAVIETLILQPVPLATTLLVQFILWSALAIFWVKTFEARPLSTIGLSAPNAAAWLGRFLGGVLIGLGLVAVLLAAGAGFAAVFPDLVPQDAIPAADQLDAGVLAEPALLTLLAAFAVIFIIQGGSEEIVFRGWLMSALAARWGTVAGVLVSSLVFASVHIHIPLASGWAFGGPVLLGIVMTGLFFAMYALAARSVVGPLAAHGAFNFGLVGSGLIAARMEDPVSPLAEVFAQVLQTATGQAGAENAPEGPILYMQAAVFALLSLVVLLRIMGRARSR